jgi:hypothetical protein
LRASVHVPADLETPACQALLKHLANSLRATNMHLETELSAVKSAVPTGKSAPYAEKLALLGPSIERDGQSDIQMRTHPGCASFCIF